MTRTTNRMIRSVAMLMFLSTAVVLPLAAQGAQPQPGGQGADPDKNTAGGDRTVNDGVYTQAQARRGEQEFRANCSMCHGVTQFTSPGYLRVMDGMPVSVLYRVIAETMPELTPGSLTREQYSDIVSYILESAGYPYGMAELPTDAEKLNQIKFGTFRP